MATRMEKGAAGDSVTELLKGVEFGHDGHKKRYSNGYGPYSESKSFGNTVINISVLNIITIKFRHSAVFPVKRLVSHFLIHFIFTDIQQICQKWIFKRNAPKWACAGN